MPDTRLLPPDPTAIGAGARVGNDPRIASGLDWCARQGFERLTLAVPFPIAPDLRLGLLGLLDDGGVQSLVLLPSPTAAPSDAVGAILPGAYSWHLPRHIGRRILFIGTRAMLSAPMLKAALRRGVRSIAYWDINHWRHSPVVVLAGAKVLSKALSACERLVSGQGLCGALLDGWYTQHIRTALAANRLLASGVTATPLRIVLACPTLVAGGAERQIVNTALGLRAIGLADVTVLVAKLHSPPGNDFFLGPLEAAGVVVSEVGGSIESLTAWAQAQRVPWLGPPGARALALLKALPTTLVQGVVDLSTILLELRPEVVHCWLDYSNIRVGLAAVIAGVPRVILSGRNVSPTHFPYIHEPFMRAAYRVLAEQPGVLLANNSRGGADDYAAWLGLPDSQFRVVYNGLDLGATGRASLEEISRLRQSMGLSEKVFVVGGLFRFSDEKRPLLWLETAARVVQMRPDVGFLLFGAGPRQPDMELFLDRSGLRDHVKLAPPTRQSALALSSFDLLLLASQWEGTPNVVIEAQAVGTPVIVAGGGGAREALEPGITGLFVENADAGALAQAVCDLLGDPVRRGAMAAAGPAFVRARFSLERMVTDTLGSYGLPRRDHPNHAQAALGRLPF